MEKRKNTKYEIHDKQSLFFLIGLSVTLSMVIFAFEWKSYEHFSIIDLQGLSNDFQEEDTPLTIHQPPKPIKPLIINPVIEEVKNEDEIPEIDVLIETESGFTEPEIFIDVLPDEPEIDVWEGIVESMPEPANGYTAYYQFLSKNMRYPKQAQKMGISGKVFIQFVIDKDGNITDAKVVKGIGFGCDEEALRVIQLSPKWTPGKQRGRAVNVRMVIPMTFQLND